MSAAGKALAQSIGQFGQSFQQMGETIYKVEADNEFRNQSLLIADGLEKFNSSLLTDPDHGTPGANEGYMKKWEEYKRSIDGDIQKVKNPLAKKNLENYMTQVTTKQQSSIYALQFDGWSKQMVADADLRIKSLFDNPGISAQFKIGAMVEELESLRAKNIIDPISYSKLKTEYSKTIYANDSADFKQFTTEISDQVKKGFDSGEAYSLYEARIDQSIALGSISESDKAVMLKAAKQAFKIDGAVGKAYSTMYVNGRITSGALDRARTAVEESGLNAQEQAEVRSKVFKQYAEDIQYQDAIDAEHDQKGVDYINQNIQSVGLNPSNIENDIVTIQELHSMLVPNYGKGNIDLNDRPVVQNEDGTMSTVKSMSIEEDGKEVLIPMISKNGSVLSKDEAIAEYKATGEYLGKFDSVEDANAYASQLHIDQQYRYSQPLQFFNSKNRSSAIKVVGETLDYLKNKKLDILKTQAAEDEDFKGQLLELLTNDLTLGSVDGNIDKIKRVEAVTLELLTGGDWDTSKNKPGLSKLYNDARSMIIDINKDSTEQKQTQSVTYYNKEINESLERPFDENYAVTGDAGSLLSIFATAQRLNTEVNMAPYADEDERTKHQNRISSIKDKVNKEFEKLNKEQKSAFKDQILTSVTAFTSSLDILATNPTEEGIASINKQFESQIKGTLDLINSVPEFRFNEGDKEKILKALGDAIVKHTGGTSKAALSIVTNKNDAFTIALEKYKTSPQSENDWEELQKAYKAWLSPKEGAEATLNAMALTQGDKDIAAKGIYSVMDAMNKAGGTRTETQRKELVDTAKAGLKNHETNLTMLQIDSSPEQRLNIEKSYQNNVKDLFVALSNPESQFTTTDKAELYGMVTDSLIKHINALSGLVGDDIKSQNAQFKLKLERAKQTGDFSTLPVDAEAWFTTISGSLNDTSLTGRDREYLAVASSSLLSDFTVLSNGHHIQTLEAEQAGNYEKLSNNILQFEQAEALYSPGEGIASDGETSIDIAYGRFIDPIFKNLGNKNLSTSQRKEIISDALAATKRYGAALRDQSKENVSLAQAKFAQSINNNISQAADTIRRYDDLGRPADMEAEFTLAKGILEQYRETLPTYYDADVKRSLLNATDYNAAKQTLDDYLSMADKLLFARNKDTKDAGDKAIREGTTNQWATLKAYFGTNTPLPMAVGDIKAGTVITSPVFSSWISKHKELEGWETKYNEALKGQGEDEQAAYSELTTYLNSAEVKKKGITPGDQFIYARELADLFNGQGGKPTTQAIKEFLDSVKTRVEDPKSFKATIEMGGADFSFSKAGKETLYHVYNGTLSGAIDGNFALRNTLVQQFVISARKWLGFSEATATEIIDGDNLHEVGVTINKDGQNIKIAAVPVFQYNNKVYTFVPEKYANGKFSGEPVLALVNDDRTITLLNNKLPHNELIAKRENANQKFTTAENQLKTEAPKIFKDNPPKDLLNVLGLKTGATSTDIAIAYSKLFLADQEKPRSIPKFNEITTMIRKQIKDWDGLVALNTILSSMGSAGKDNVEIEKALAERQ